MTARRTNRFVWLAVALVLASAISVTAAATADAADYDVLVCNRMTNGLENQDPSFFPIQPSGVRAENNCPIELVLSNDFGSESEYFTMQGDYGGFDSPWSPAPIRQLELDVMGGDQTGALEYSIAECLGCEAIDLIVPNDGSEWQRQTVDMGLLEHFVIQARCVAIVCPPTTPFRMRNLRFEVVDETPPMIPEPKAVTTDDDFGHSPLGWVGDGNFRLIAGASDDGAGVAWVKIEIDGEEVWHSAYCDFSFGTEATTFGPCPADVYHNAEFDLSAITGGEHTLTITAVDVAGNQAEPYTETFHVDNVPPRQPENLRISNPVGFGGWSHESDFMVAFDPLDANPLQTPGAPPKYIAYDVEPLGDGLVDPAASILAPDWTTVPLVLPEEGRWRLWVWVIDEAGLRSNKSHIDLGLDYDAPSAPQLDRNEWISLSELHSGYSQTWIPGIQEPELESGICGYAVAVDDVFATIPEIALDLPAGATSALAPAAIGAGRHFAHVRAVACNGRGSDVSNAQLNVDGTAPEVSSFPGGSQPWSAQATTVGLSGADDLSGVSYIEYSIGGASPVRIDGSQAYVDMPEGANDLTFTAVDKAGNASTEKLTTVRTDLTAPTVGFAPRSSANPSMLTANVEDGGSGVANAWIELSEAGSGAWRQLGPAVAPDAANAVFSREISDLLALVGRYRFRVVAVDRVGNRTYGSPGQGSVELDLPVKRATVMTLGLAEVRRRCVTAAGRSCRSLRDCPRKSRCRTESKIDVRGASSEARIRFGEDMALVGTLNAPDGSPLSNRPIEIVARPKFGQEAVIALPNTDAEGKFELRLPDAPTTLYTARFKGDEINLSQQRTAELKVRANVTLKLSRKRVAVNRPLRFSGRVLGAPQYAADGGKIVTIQFLRGGRWYNGVGSPRTDANGRFSASFTWPAIAKPTRIHFHARVIPDGSWPFESGSSERVSVVVVPR